MVALISFISTNTFANDNVFIKKNIVVNATVGIGNSIYGGGYSNKFIPLSISGEYGIKDNLFGNGKGTIGAGLYFGYTGAKEIDDYPIESGQKISIGYKYSSIIIGARGALHYQFVKNLDTYAGLMLGYNGASAKFVGDDIYENNAEKSSVGGFAFAIYAGARYYITEHFGFVGELGYGVSYLNLGLTYKF